MTQDEMLAIAREVGAQMAEANREAPLSPADDLLRWRAACVDVLKSHEVGHNNG